MAGKPTGCAPSTFAALQSQGCHRLRARARAGHGDRSRHRLRDRRERAATVPPTPCRLCRDPLGAGRGAEGRPLPGLCLGQHFYLHIIRTLVFHECCRCHGDYPSILEAYEENAFKLGLLERQIEDVLQRLHQEQTKSRGNSLVTTLHQENDRCTNQRETDEKDVCPICQELLKKMLPITYCRYSCGNNINIKMKIWADHQDELENDFVVKCPLCREKFAPLRLILETFRNSKQLVTVTEKARLARHLGIPCNNCTLFTIVGERYKLAPGIQCRLCLKSFQLGQHVRLLPCNHKFHRECIDSWLLHQGNTCPVDQHVVYNPLTWKDTSAKHRKNPTGSHTNIVKLASKQN
ncbi:LOW QUALITY PROTEIN: E3 ubiquitin-protein ligase ZSWIM2 [Chlamydotis macqueenii]